MPRASRSRAGRAGAPARAAATAPPTATCPAELDAVVCAALARGEDERVGALLPSLKGASLRQRIIAYEAFARAHPKSRHAAVLYEEAAELRKCLARPSGEHLTAARTRPRTRRFRYRRC